MGKLTLANNVPGQYYLELDIIGSKLIHEQGIKEQLVASYCASQLYRRIPSKSLKGNSGVNIIFDSERNMIHPKQHFYQTEELEKASVAIDNINNYLGFLLENDLESASSCIDTTYFNLELEELHKTIRNSIEGSIKESYHFFSQITLETQKDSGGLNCLSFVVVIIDSNSNQVPLDFLVSADKPSYNIINLALGI